MAEKIGYLSPEWRDEVEKHFKEELTAEKMKYLTTSVAFNYLDCPDGKDRCLFFRCDNGIFTEIVVDENTCRQAEFVITGSYELFAKVTQGFLSSQRALMSGKLKVRGNMVKALKLASLADRMNKIMARIPSAY